MVVGLLYALGAMVLCKLRPTEPTAASTAGGGPTIRELIREPILRNFGCSRFRRDELHHDCSTGQHAFEPSPQRRLLLAASSVVSLIGNDVPHYWAGLVLLGGGWNFLFTAGTALIATHYAGADRHRACTDGVECKARSCTTGARDRGLRCSVSQPALPQVHGQLEDDFFLPVREPRINIHREGTWDIHEQPVQPFGPPVGTASAAPIHHWSDLGVLQH
jgi:hypothetical protein